MPYPSLVPVWACKTPIHVTVYTEGLSECGEPLAAVDGDFLCNWQDGARTVTDDQKKMVEIIGSAYFFGDIAPECAVISGGEAVIFGKKRTIYKGTKARNPDGTVNYIKLELI